MKSLGKGLSLSQILDRTGSLVWQLEGSLLSSALLSCKIISMRKIMTYPIDQMQEAQTVEQFLRSMGYSKKLLIHLRQTDLGLTIDGKLVYTTHVLSAGEILTVRLIENLSSGNIVPTPMELNIVYEDEDILVINKAADTPVHPSQGNYNNTLANGIAHYYADKGIPFVYRAVNRLDRDTTGLLILAKHMLSACILSRMVKEHKIKRQYLAIVTGKPASEGTIDAPISRLDGSTIERCVNWKLGETAVTHYRLLYYHQDFDCSLAALRLETGRTHQIRVHMKHIGHPLPGDFLYNPDYRRISRQPLHSLRLDFPHPISKDMMHFEAPIPDDMKFIGFTSTEGLWDNDF